MSSGGFARFARRPPSKPTNENAVNDNNHSSALESAPEASTEPSANDLGFESSWETSGGFGEESGGDWLDGGFDETVESHIKSNENRGNQGGIIGISLFKSKTNSATGASSAKTPSETTTAPTPPSFSGTEINTPVQAPTAQSFPAPSTHFQHDSSTSKTSAVGREWKTHQQTAPTAFATPYPYSTGGRGPFAARNDSNQSSEHMGLEQGFSSGIVEREVSLSEMTGAGVALANHHQIDKRAVTAGNVGTRTSAGVKQYDSNKTPGPTTHPTTAQARSRESSGNTESAAAFDSQFPPAVTPATMEKASNNETPFRGTLSQFDTSLVSPDHNKDGTMEMGVSSNEKSRTSGNMGDTESNPEAISEEAFSQIFLSIKNEQLAFDDGNSAYDDRMLELSSVLCFEHGNMLTFEASCSEGTEEIENVSDLLDNAIASHDLAS